MYIALEKKEKEKFHLEKKILFSVKLFLFLQIFQQNERNF